MVSPPMVRSVQFYRVLFFLSAFLATTASAGQANAHGSVPKEILINLRSSDENIRTTALNQLLSEGQKGVPVSKHLARAFAREKSAALRETICRRILIIDASRYGIEEVMWRGLKDKDPNVRLQAIKSLSACDYITIKDMAEVLLSATNGNDEYRTTAVLSVADAVAKFPKKMALVLAVPQRRRWRHLHDISARVLNTTPSLSVSSGTSVPEPPKTTNVSSFRPTQETRLSQSITEQKSKVTDLPKEQHTNSSVAETEPIVSPPSPPTKQSTEGIPTQAITELVEPAQTQTHERGSANNNWAVVVGLLLVPFLVVVLIIWGVISRTRTKQDQVKTKRVRLYKALTRRDVSSNHKTMPLPKSVKDTGKLVESELQDDTKHPPAKSSVSSPISKKQASKASLSSQDNVYGKVVKKQKVDKKRVSVASEYDLGQPEEKIITISRIKDGDCPFKYYKGYIEEPRQKPCFESIEAGMGSFFHSYLENKFKEVLVRDGSICDDDVIDINDLITNFRLSFVWEGKPRKPYKIVGWKYKLKDFIQRLKIVAKNFNQFLRSNMLGHQIVAVEGRLQIATDDIYIRGKYDLITREPTKTLVLWDWKTGQAPKPEYYKDFTNQKVQLGIYAIWMRYTYDITDVRGSAVFLRDTCVKWKETFTPKIIADVLAYCGTQRQKLNSYTSYPAIPNNLCPWCGWNPICKTQSEARMQPVADKTPESPHASLSSSGVAGKSGLKSVRVGKINAQATHSETPSPNAPIMDSLPDDFEITPEYSDALKMIAAETPLVFLTGKAGTGKSTFIQYVRQALDKRNVVVVAPTGVAALTARGSTIHSFFRFPPKPLNKEDIRVARDRTLYEKTDLLIIDEVSMVRADLLDAIDMFLRLNAKDANKPFGGVQVLLVGDLFQLPPVVTRKEEGLLFSRKYKSPFFFSAKCLENCDLFPFQLTKVYRQDQREFIEFLDRVRLGKDLNATLDEINQACHTNAKSKKSLLTLTCTNARAGTINAKRLKALPGKTNTFQGKIEGQFPIAEDKLPSPYNLHIKIGAQVMFTKNDTFKQWVNGTMGIVKDIAEEQITVELITDHAGAICDVQRVWWESLKYEYDYAENKIVATVVGRYQQFPLMLAWAVTIHKGQSKTLDSVLVDLGRGAFASGQVYVALSRCRSLEGITLKKPIRIKDVKCDERIRRFYKLLGLL